MSKKHQVFKMKIQNLKQKAVEIFEYSNCLTFGFPCCYQSPVSF